MILLDSDALIELLRENSKRGQRVNDSLASSGENFGTTSISLHEVLYGLRKYANPLGALSQLPVIEFAEGDAETSSQIEVDMEKSGSPVRRMDTMIAAIAINHSMKLLTLDTKHFGPLSKKTALKLFS